MAAVQVVPDVTFFIQLGNFIITLLVLNLLLFKPIREIIKKRQEIISGGLDEIERFSAEAESKLKNYEETLSSARKEGGDIRSALKDEGVTEEQQILSAAGQDAAAELKSAREKVGAEMKSAKDALSKDVQKYAELATGKILGQA